MIEDFFFSLKGFLFSSILLQRREESQNNRIRKSSFVLYFLEDPR